MESIASDYSEAVSLEELPDYCEVVRRPQYSSNSGAYAFYRKYGICVNCCGESDSGKTMCGYCRPLWSAENSYYYMERRHGKPGSHLLESENHL